MVACFHPGDLVIQSEDCERVDEQPKVSLRACFEVFGLDRNTVSQEAVGTSPPRFNGILMLGCVSLFAK